MSCPNPTQPVNQLKGDIIVGGHKFVVLSREDNSIIVSSKATGSKVRHSTLSCLAIDCDVVVDCGVSVRVV